MDFAQVIKHKNHLEGRTLHTKTRRKLFTVEQVSERGVFVSPRDSKSLKPRLISQADIQAMGSRWDDFKEGLVSRALLANGNPANMNTSYLESIFIAIEEVNVT